jgi:hypothetical protein
MDTLDTIFSRKEKLQRYLLPGTLPFTGREVQFFCFIEKLIFYGFKCGEIRMELHHTPTSYISAVDAFIDLEQFFFFH